MSFDLAMSRRLLVAVAFLAVLAAAAEVPEMCRLPQNFTVRAPREVPLADFVLLCTARRLKPTAAPKGKNAFLRLEVTDAGTPEHPEGYATEITKNGIVVRSRSRSGLFYGVLALNDLLRKHPDGALPCGRLVAEAPDFDERAVAFSIARRSANRRDLDRLKRMLKILAGLRCNRVILEFGANFPAPGLFPRKDAPLGEKELREIVDFSTAHFIRIVPMLRVWSDCELLKYRKDLDDLVETRVRGASNPVYCPRLPEVRQLLRETVRSQCAALRPEEFFFCIDWNALDGGIRRCPRCRDVAVEALVAEHLAFLAGCAAENHVRPAFILLGFPDDLAAKLPAMLPAGTPLYGLTAAGRTPDAAPAGDPKLNEKIARSLQRGAKRFILLAQPHVFDGDLAGGLFNTTPAFLGGVVDGAFAMWPPAVPVGNDPVRYFRMLHGGAAALDDRRAKATPVPLWAQLNAELGATGIFPCFDPKPLEVLRRDLRNSPERFELPVCFGGRYYGILLAGDRNDDRLPRKVELQLNGVKAAGVALLLAASPPRNPADFDPATRGKYAFGYFDVAIVELNYADGSRVGQGLNFHRHLTPWNEDFGGYDRHDAVVEIDARGRRFRFDAFTFANPHPDKPLTGISIRSFAAHGIAPAVLALSLLDMTEGVLPEPDPDAELLRINFRPSPAATK